MDKIDEFVNLSQVFKRSVRSSARDVHWFEMQLEGLLFDWDPMAGCEVSNPT